MFDLNSNIQYWRENLAAEAVYSPTDLDELESHLREEVSIIQKQNLTEQEAFTVACLRLGDSRCLSREFAKVNAGLVFRRRLFWMCAGLLVYIFITKLATFFSQGAILVGAFTGVQGYALGILAQSIHIAFLVLAIMYMIRLLRRYSTMTFPTWLQLKKGKVVLFVGFAGLSLVILIGPTLMTAAAVRILTPSDYGAMAIIGNIANFM